MHSLWQGSAPDHRNAAMSLLALHGDVSLVQQEDFTSCVRNNIRDYGDGITCFRELLANADDAGATEFVLCLDKTPYDTLGLFSNRAESLLGPAFLVGNNAEFTAADLRSFVKSVGRSRKVNDASTTGKFGLGALTVYKLSEAPQLLSGEQLLVLDPQGTYLADNSRSICYNFVTQTAHNQNNLSCEAPGSLLPFVSFSQNCSEIATLSPSCAYHATLFRLALRTKAAAEHSQLSNQSFDAEQATALLKQFAQAAADLLLFTRHITKISVFERDATSPCTLIHQSIAAKSNIAAANEANDMLHSVQKVTVTFQHGDGNQGQKQWMRVTKAAEPGKGAGIAALMWDDHSPAVLMPNVDGRVYNTMPLPFELTHLPVHLNGTFAVSADRRRLWDGEGDHGQVSMYM